MGTLKYKRYEGTAEVDTDRCVCRGKILFINDLVIYEAESPAALKKAFEEAVDDYIETCAELGREPKKPLKGQFNVRISPELHKDASLRAIHDGITLNELVGKAISAFVHSGAEVNYNYHYVSVAQSDNNFNTWLSSPYTGTQFFEGTAHATAN